MKYITPSRLIGVLGIGLIGAGIYVFLFVDPTQVLLITAFSCILLGFISCLIASNYEPKESRQYRSLDSANFRIPNQKFCLETYRKPAAPRNPVHGNFEADIKQVAPRQKIHPTLTHNNNAQRIYHFYAGQTVKIPRFEPLISVTIITQANFQWLENQHRYIQTCFPLNETSKSQTGTPWLKDEEFICLVEQPGMHDRFKDIFSKMAAFYGFTITYQTDGCISVVKNPKTFSNRKKNLAKNSHNNSRLTRILYCLICIDEAVKLSEKQNMTSHQYAQWSCAFGSKIIESFKDLYPNSAETWQDAVKDSIKRLPDKTALNLNA